MSFKSPLCLIFSGAFLLSLSACSPQSTGPVGNLSPQLENITSFFKTKPAENAKVVVVDETGAPISQARIMIGQNLEKGKSLIVTNQSGEALLPEWSGEKALTVDAPGYIRVTYCNQTYQNKTLKMRRADEPDYLELKGVTSGFGKLERDGRIDFGLVVPAVSRQDLFSFDIGLMISAQNDHMSVAGRDLEIPSNLTFPTQKESYSLITLTFDKPNYRTYFHTRGVKKVFATHGSFPLKQVVDAMRNNTPFQDLLNYFSFASTSFRDLDIEGNMSMDLPVNEINFDQTLRVKAPAFGKDDMVIAAALMKTAGLMVPTDIKRLTANQESQLQTSAQFEQEVLSVLRKSADYSSTSKDQRGRLSAVINKSAQIYNPRFLDLIDTPQVISATQVQVQAPKINDVATPIATYSVLSYVHNETRGGEKIEQITRAWEIYYSTWVSEIDLPEWPENLPIEKGSMRWEVSYVGQEVGQKSSQPVVLGPELLQDATHATHASKDF